MSIFKRFFSRKKLNFYIAQVFNCYPMTDTKYTHTNSTPNKMLLKKNVIKIPNRETKKKKKTIQKS